MSEQLTARVTIRAGCGNYGIGKMLPNKTKLARSSAKLSFSCPICGITFERYACWAKRVSVCYCSRGCASEGQRVSVMVECRWCKNEFPVVPAKLGKVVSCSMECRDLYRRNTSGSDVFHGLKEYVQAAKMLKAADCRCRDCGTSIGPFYARYGISDRSATLDQITRSITAQCQKCYGIERLKITRNHIKHAERTKGDQV